MKPRRRAAQQTAAARPWRRRLVRAMLIAACALLIFRLSLSVLLPTAIARIAHGFGLHCEYQRLKLSLLGTNASMWGVVIKTADGKQEILRTDYATANLSTLQLFKLRLVAWRVEADDVRVAAVRKADGSIPLLEHLAAKSGTPTGKPSAPKSPSFSSPLRIDALRLHRLALGVRDETVTPPFEDVINVSVRVSNVGRSGVPVQLEVGATASGLFSAASVAGHITVSPASIDADVDFGVRGLRADRVAAYLVHQGLTADARGLDAQGKGVVRLKVSKDLPGALEGSARLSDLSLISDADSVARLTYLNADIKALSPSLVHLSDVRIDGGVVRAQRTREGRIRFASLLTLGDAELFRPPQKKGVSAEASAKPIELKLDRLYATGLTATLDDVSVSPSASLGVLVSELRVTELSSAGAVDQGPEFMVRIAAPRAVESIRIDGKALPFAQQPSVLATVDVAGIRPDALEPYLAAMGIRSTLESASLQCQIDGTWGGATPGRGGAVISKVALVDRGVPLVEAGPVIVKGLGVSADGELLIDSLQGAGPTMNVRRHANGELELVGLRVGVGSKPARAPAARARAREESTPLRISLPPARIGRVAWSGVRVRFEDEVWPENGVTELAEAGVDLQDLTIASADVEPTPASLRAWLRAPGLLNAIECTGSVEATTESVRLEAGIAGESIDLRRLSPYLAGLGIEPTLTGGTLGASVVAGIETTEHGVKLYASARDVSLTQEGQSLLSASDFAVDAVELQPAKVIIGPVRVSEVSVSAVRDKEGAVAIAGVRILPPAPTEAEEGPLPDPLALIGSLGTVDIEGVAVRDVRVSWTDHAARAPVETVVGLNATVGPFSINTAGSVGSWSLDLTAERAIGSLRARGEVESTRQSARVSVQVQGTGLGTEMIAAYLPDGVRGTLQDGALTLTASGEVKGISDGSIAALARIQDLEFHSGTGEPSLARVDDLEIRIGSLDLASGDVRVERIGSRGVGVHSSRHPDGSLHLLGLAYRPPAPPAVGQGSERPLKEPTSDAPTLERVMAKANRPPPRIAVDEVDVFVSSLSFTDLARPSSAPLIIGDLVVRSEGPFVILGPDAASNPPARLHVTGGVEPVIGRFGIDLDIAPFAERPSAAMGVQASGISGQGLARAVPELNEFVDATALTDGRFSVRIAADAKVQRRGDWIDLGRGLEVNLVIDNAMLVAGANGPVLLGVETVRAEQVRLEPATGNMAARNVEIENISGRAWRDQTGVHVLGVLVRLPGKEAGKEDGAADGADPATTEPKAAPESPPRSGPEFRIDRLSMTGLDFQFDDRAVSPPVTIPLNALDAEVRGLSSMLLEQERPVRFTASVGAGKVSLPGRSSVRAGTDGLQQDSRDQDIVTIEEREFFSQCMANGTMVLYPAPRGRAVATMNGLELGAVRGLAQEAGASVGGGLFDGRVELRARGDGAVDVRTRVVLTDLKYAEPASGPVERYMALPVPADLAIAAVEAADGSITLPINITVDERGLTTGKLVRSIALAAGQVVATAVASAPVKVVSGFAALFGEEQEGAQWIEDPAIYLDYPVGVTVLGADAAEKLDGVLRRARADSRVQVAIEHDLGVADASVLLRRANPNREQILALIEDLKVRRDALVARRAELLRPAAAAALGVGEVGDAIGVFHGLLDEVAEVEDSLDRLYELLGPSAAAAESRRARTQAVDLIDARMAAVRGRVTEAAGSRGSSRVVVGRGRPEASEAQYSRLVVRVRQRRD